MAFTDFWIKAIWFKGCTWNSDVQNVCPFDITTHNFAYSNICPLILINFFWTFIFYFSDSRKFIRSKFKSSLIFKLETSAILKFYGLKF